MPRRADKSRGRHAARKGAREPSAELFGGSGAPTSRRPRMDKTDTQASVSSDTEDLDMPSATAEKPIRHSASSNGNGNGKAARRETAESMATKQRDISVSEFFAKNRHLLGFDYPRKALLTTVKEAVDN